MESFDGRSDALARPASRILMACPDLLARIVGCHGPAVAGHLGHDETNYILKSWWYVTGTVKPYSAEDSTWYQPLIFYVVGVWQLIAGHGIVAARIADDADHCDKHRD